MKMNVAKMYSELSPQEFASLTHTLLLRDDEKTVDEIYAARQRTQEEIQDAIFRASMFNCLAASHQISQLQSLHSPFLSQNVKMMAKTY